MGKSPSNNPESPEYLRMSLAAAMTPGFKPGLFYRNARRYCINLLLTYKVGCAARCTNSRPRPEMRNYPFPPNGTDIDLIREQLNQPPICPDAVVSQEIKMVPVACDGMLCDT